MRNMKRGKRKLDEEKEESSTNQPPLKLKLSLTKSPVKGNVEFSVVGNKEGKRKGRGVEESSSPPPPFLSDQSPPRPPSPRAAVKRKVKRPALIEDDPQRPPSPKPRSPPPIVKR